MPRTCDWVSALLPKELMKEVLLMIASQTYEPISKAMEGEQTTHMTNIAARVRRLQLGRLNIFKNPGLSCLSNSTWRTI